MLAGYGREKKKFVIQYGALYSRYVRGAKGKMGEEPLFVLSHGMST